MNEATRLEVGIVGFGKVGAVLGVALAGAGHRVIAVSGVSEESRERAEAMLPGIPILPTDEVVRRSQIVVFAVPASELLGLISGLTQTGAWQPGQIALHTVAMYGYGVFREAMAHGVIPIAFHPAMVFTGTSLDVAKLQEATIAVTAPTPVLPIAQALAVELGAEPIVIAEDDRDAYADAVDALAELSRALVRQSIDSLGALGVEMPARTVSGIARAAVDAALLETPRTDPEL